MKQNLAYYFALAECLSGNSTWKSNVIRPILLVMLGLVPGIYAFATAAGSCFERVDGRVKPGHDVV